MMLISDRIQVYNLQDWTMLMVSGVHLLKKEVSILTKYRLPCLKIGHLHYTGRARSPLHLS